MSKLLCGAQRFKHGRITEVALLTWTFSHTGGSKTIFSTRIGFHLVCVRVINLKWGTAFLACVTITKCTTSLKEETFYETIIILKIIIIKHWQSGENYSHYQAMIFSGSCTAGCTLTVTAIVGHRSPAPSRTLLSTFKLCN